jgi:hypothetical protein
LPQEAHGEPRAFFLFMARIASARDGTLPASHRPQCAATARFTAPAHLFPAYAVRPTLDKAAHALK